MPFCVTPLPYSDTTAERDTHQLKNIHGYSNVVTVTVFSLPVGHQAHSTCNAWATLPAETFETRESLFSLSLAKPRYNGKAILKNYEPFIYGYTHY